MPTSTRALALLAAIVTGACTTIRIEAQSKDDVEISTRFGIVSIELTPGAKSVVVDSSSFGAINTFDGLAVGYHRARYAALGPKDCRVVLWIQTDEQLREIDQLLRNHSQICVVSSTEANRSKK